MGIRRMGTVAVVIAAGAALSGCATTTPDDSPTASSPGPSTSATATTAAGTTASAQAATPSTTKAPRTEKWINLQPGDCLADVPPTDPAVVEVTLVDCSQPHIAEAFLRAPIPVDAALDDTAKPQCQAALPQYTGGAGGPYTITYLIDSDQDRTGNNPLPSTVICLLEGVGGQSLTGSAAQS